MQTLTRAIFSLLAIPVLLAGLCACDDDDGPAPAPASRVEAVQARETQRSPEAFCDVMPPASEAARFTTPELAETAATDASKWRWVNVWATWCAPCVEEIPTLVEWEQRYANDGTPVELVLISVDDDAEAVQTFRHEHPTVPESSRIADPDAVTGWLESLGLEGATLPVHILVDPQGRVRCLRAGAIGDDDYGAVAQLVAG